MPDVSVVEGGYWRDILDQPKALADTHAGLETAPGLDEAAQRLVRGEFDRVVLTGMGGSLHALHPLNLLLLRRGAAAVMMETSELIHCIPGILNRRTLVIAASQSGRSAEIVRLLQIRPRDCFTLGICNTPGSPLAAESDAVLLTRAGAEVTVSCKTYVATLMAAAWAGDRLTGGEPGKTRDELAQAAPAAEVYLSRWRDHVGEAAGQLRNVRHLFYLGRGSSLATAGTAGLITKESAHFHAEGMSSAAFRHGPFEMLSAAVFALVFTGSPEAASLNAKLVADIARAGGRAALTGEEAELDVFRLPRVPRSVRPICEILPVEMMTLALAALAGREAGKFERASKVTDSE